jgi:thiamine biosynthesis lipoprotein ApbE
MCGFGPDGWPVDIAHPLTRRPMVRVQLYDAALATSALQRPEGGAPGTAHLPNARWDSWSVTVEAPEAMDADALTKIILAASEETARHCLAAAGARALRIDRRGQVQPLEPGDRP